MHRLASTLLTQMYREERPTARKCCGRKHALNTREWMAISPQPDERWSLDVVSDTLACGRRFRSLDDIDAYNRECLACIVDTSLSGHRVIGELGVFAERHGHPCRIYT